MSLSGEDLQAIKLLLEPLNSEIKEVKSGQSELREEVRVIRVNQEELSANQEKLSESQDKLRVSQEKIENEVRGIQLIIENEIRPNIKIIAEGHLDLNRKLNHIMETENHNEMLGIRLNVLEGEFKRLQDANNSKKKIL